VNPELAAKGAIGRSEGCFALQQDQVGQIIDRLGAGRMILAMKARHYESPSPSGEGLGVGQR